MPKYLIIAFIFIGFSFGGCRQSDKSAVNGMLPGNTDTLKVGTLYGPISYFLYRGEEMGFEYENIKQFANEENLHLDIHIAPNITELIRMLEKGEIHIAAYPIPNIAEYNDEIIYCGPTETTSQVLVQKANEYNLISDVTELPGKTIFVEGDSRFQYRLENLNDELGGGIVIKSINNDTISVDDLIKMVDMGRIEYSVVDSETAKLNKELFPNIDTSLSISLEQTSSWAVAPGLDSLASVINSWEKSFHDSPFVKEIYKRYYERGKYEFVENSLSYFKNRNKDKISPYDNLFKKYASEAGYDWRLLAAISYCESGFDPDARSSFGATGLMQVMPLSAAGYGFDPSLLTNPAHNINAAVKIIENIDKLLRSKVPDSKERIKFMLAAYNAGIGHIFDAIALAAKYGMDPGKWTGNVSVTSLMKARPEYYNDPVVKNGYFRGRETVEFVEKVMSVYNYLKSLN